MTSMLSDATEQQKKNILQWFVSLKKNVVRKINISERIFFVKK